MSRYPGKPKRLECSIRCSRTSSNIDEDSVVFRVVDNVSNIVVIDIQLGIAEFGDMISSPKNVQCLVDLFSAENLGKKMEHKHEIVPRPGINATEKEIAEILKLFEVDGWFGDAADAANHHNWIDFAKVKVGFVRWVDSEDSKET